MPLGPVGQIEKVRALGANGRHLVVGGVRAADATQLTVYDHVAEKVERTIDVPAHVLGLYVAAKEIWAACSDGKVRVHAIANGNLERTIDAHTGACRAIACRDNLIATVGDDGALRLWDPAGKKKKEHAISSRPLRAVALENATTFAVGGDDGVIRVLRDGEPTREMPGHDGPVTCLAFTPADGRLVSGGDDGTFRVWYLVGALESEVRSKDDTLHVGGTTAILFPPSKERAPGSPTADDFGDRVATAGFDGKVRIWRMSERRKPKTLDGGSTALHALAFAPSTRSGTSGNLFTAGDSRTLTGFAFDDAGAPTDVRIRLLHGFDLLEAALAGQGRPQRESAIKMLAALAETEALELLVKHLGVETDAEVRALVVTELAAHGRRDARKAIRARLDDEGKAVRAVALPALRKLEPEAPLAPLRAALGARFPDVRIAALEALSPLASSSPLVGGLVAAALADDDAAVRRRALRELVAIHPAGSIDPLRIAFERGRADIRVEVLVRGAAAGLAAGGHTGFMPIVGKALDDEDADVRRTAFVVSALARPALAGWLDVRDESFTRALDELVRRACELSSTGPSMPAGVDPEPATVKSLSATFAQFTHPRHGDVAIFKPNMHTPIAVGAEVYLKDIAPGSGGGGARAADYVVGTFSAVSDAQIAEMRRRLVAPPPKVPPEPDREPLLAALACRTPDTSLRGARGLAIAADMRALGALLTISREPSPALRREAAHALVALADPRAKRRLAWMMNDADAGVRDAALACFAKLEPDVLAVAEAALHASHEDMRVRGLDLLVKHGKGKPEAETLLGHSIEDEAQKVRVEAFATLWEWHPNDPLGTLDRALVARFPDLRHRAARELAAFAKKPGPLAAPSLEKLAKTIGDRDASVAKAAYDATLEIKGKDNAETHLAALASTHPTLRIEGAKDATKAPPDKVRSALSKLLEDADARVRVAALEALDVLLPTEPGPVLVGLQSSHLDLRVRAAELLAVRREEQLIEPMRALIGDKDLLERMPQTMVPLRQRASSALATLGSPRLLKYFATDLVKDDDAVVREQAARGVSNASRRGEEGYLLDLLGHADLPVRSWAADGLARLGDPRALPVLTGTLRHEHPPIRVGAILSFAALGPEGYGGMLQGLEDPSRDVQRVVLSVILARDLRAFRHNEAPELLMSALSSQRPEVRFAAARALELRITPEQYIAYLVEILMPDKPERAADMERWPNEETRARLMIGLAEALAGDRPEQRYAAAQALRLRDRPLDYFREVQRASALRSTSAPWVPDTTPRGATPSDAPPKGGPLAFVRKLFSRGPDGAGHPATSPVPEGEAARLRQLAFGAYVGLLRQSSEDDEAHRVRRDAIERLVELVAAGHASLASATPALARALDDPHHLVRQAAFAALKKTFAADPEVPLALALGSGAADVVRAALDELATRGDAAKPRIAKALDSRVAAARKYAFELLEKTSPPGDVEPLLAALGSEHADIRIGVLAGLATSRDPRVAIALGKALESDHEDLRLRAAEMLAQRRDDRAADALAPWLRSDDAAIATRARNALSLLGSLAAVRALASRLEDGVAPAERVAIANAVAATRAGVAAIDALVTLVADEEAEVRAAAVEGAMGVLGPRGDAPSAHGEPKPKPRDPVLAGRFLATAARARHAEVRARAAAELDDLTDATVAEPLLVAMFGDRDPAVRTAAVKAYATRVEKAKAPAAPLEDVLRGGARETMLPAAEGLAHQGFAGALRALLLYVRAGEPGQPERALLALGTLGDKRALAELETVANGGTEEAPADLSMQTAALEALGRIAAKIDPDDRERVRDKIEASVGTRENAMATAAVRALRWLGGERARTRIEGVLAASSSSESERIEAAKALGELGDAAAEPALGLALRDASLEVAWHALEALEKLFPTDRTRVEFFAVESHHAAISERAASFLANEGDAARLLAKLAKLSQESLRQRIRFGLVRRKSLPTRDLARLLDDPSPRARADAAWVVAVRALATAEVSLAQPLVVAARKAESGYIDAVGRGDGRACSAESEAWVRALWATRLVDAIAIRSDARRWLVAGAAAPAPTEPPPSVRIEAAFALWGGSRDDVAALRTALVDRDLAVRSAAATSLAPASDPLAFATPPLDAVRIGLAGDGSMAKPEGRRAFLASAIRRKDSSELASLAGRRNLDAIAALGRIANAEAITTLDGLTRTGDEGTRKAAFRALRRARRRAEKEGGVGQ